MNVVAIIQARMGSTRLPGKVMKKLENKTVLAHVVDRCKAMELVNDIVIATTDLPIDDKIIEEAKRLGVRFFRGSEQDVLSRYYWTAWKHHADIIVRVTSDCPLLEPSVSDQVIRELLQNPSIDYACNTMSRTYPRGLDTEAVTFAALERAYQGAEEPYEREHVTPFIYQNPQQFNLFSLTNDVDYSSYRWTLDTQEDWKFIQSVFQRCYKNNQIFSWQDVIDLLEREPNLAFVNAHVEQKKL